MQTILQILIALVFSQLSVSECAEDTSNEVAIENPSLNIHWIQSHVLEVKETTENA